MFWFSKYPRRSQRDANDVCELQLDTDRCSLPQNCGELTEEPTQTPTDSGYDRYDEDEEDEDYQDLREDYYDSYLASANHATFSMFFMLTLFLALF